MSRFTFALALLLALFSFTSAETIVTDSAGNGIQLPTTGGSITNFITVTNTPVSTSPYHLYVSINDGQGPNSPLSPTEVEAFYFNTPGVGVVNSSSVQFGDATLISQLYSSTFQKDAGVAGNFVHNDTNPNTNIGTYTFVFEIPVLSTLTLNMTYNQTGANPLPITEFIQISIFNPVPSVVGDPQFIGLRGQSYQVHGIDGAVYNIISEENTQVNSRFVFLTSGDCPIIDGKKDVNCWSHPGSYLGEMGFQSVVAGKVHRALLQAGTAKLGFASVQVDGTVVAVGERVQDGDFSLHLTSTHTVTVTTDSFEFHLSNSDLFINQQLKARVPLSELKAHGLIGQTRSTRTYPTSLRYIEGDVDDYVIADSDIYGSDFVYNRFLA